MRREERSLCSPIMRKKQIDQFYIDGDVNIPEVKPAAGEVLHSVGEAKIEDVKVMDSYIRVSGRLKYQILYMSMEEERVCELSGKIPFEEMIYIEDEIRGIPYLTIGYVDINHTLVHGRKISLKAMVELGVVQEAGKEECLTIDVDNPEGVYRKWEGYELLHLCQNTKGVFRWKDEIEVAEGGEQIERILYTKLTPGKLDSRLGSGEIEIRGDLNLFLIYETPEEKMKWIEKTCSYEGTIPCEEAESGRYHQTQVQVGEEKMEPRMDENGELRLLGIEVSLELPVRVYEERQIKVLKDLYSLQKDLEIKREKVRANQLVRQLQSKYKLREKIRIFENEKQILQICHVHGTMELLHTEIVTEGLMMEGMLHLSVIYVSEESSLPLEVWNGSLPFTYVQEIKEIDAGMEYQFAASLEQLQLTPTGGREAEVRAEIGIQIFLYRHVEFENIIEITEKEKDKSRKEKLPGVVGYIVQPGDELWDLAKEYETTVEMIKETNGLEEDTLKESGKLLIFKGEIGIL